MISFLHEASWRPKIDLKKSVDLLGVKEGLQGPLGVGEGDVRVLGFRPPLSK